MNYTEDFENQFNELKKSIEADKKLNYFKAELLKILDRQEKEDEIISKSIESYDLSMQKSLLYEYGIEKGRAANVGDIREWKGQKYKKVAPGDWRKIYKDSNNQVYKGIEKLKTEIDECTTSQQLLDLILLHKDRFQYKDGTPFPILKELSIYVDQKNERLNSIPLILNKKSQKEYKKNYIKKNQQVYSEKRNRHIREDIKLKTINFKQKLIDINTARDELIKLKDKVLENNSSKTFKVTIGNTGIKELLRGSALKTTLKNGFTEEELYTLASKIDVLFKNATFVSKEPDRDGNIDLEKQKKDTVQAIHRYAVGFDLNGHKGFGLITIKETLKYGNKLYALGLELLQKK